MPKSTQFADALLNLMLRAEAIPDLAENDSSSPLANWYISLHTADPGVGGSQTTNEVAYTNYARVAVARSGSGWAAASSGASSNVAQIQFPQCGATGATATFLAIGKAASGTGYVAWSGACSTLLISDTITPLFAIGALDLSEA